MKQRHLRFHRGICDVLHSKSSAKSLQKMQNPLDQLRWCNQTICWETECDITCNAWPNHRTIFCLSHKIYGQGLGTKKQKKKNWPEIYKNIIKWKDFSVRKKNVKIIFNEQWSWFLFLHYLARAMLHRHAMMLLASQHLWVLKQTLFLTTIFYPPLCSFPSKKPPCNKQFITWQVNKVKQQC